MKEFCFQCKEEFEAPSTHLQAWTDSGLCPKCYGEAMENLNFCPRCSTDGMEIGEIRYTTLSGQEHKVSDDFKTNGMKVIWEAYMENKRESDNPRVDKLLDEAHSIMSAVLYGTIKRRDK